MNFKLNRTGSVLNRRERLNFNENWDKLEKVISDRGLEILSEEWFIQYLETSGIKHREEVATFDDLPSNDSLNTVRGVADDNKIYIKKENGWVPFQSIDINKINEVELKVDNIGVSAINFGVTGNGVQDDTVLLQELINSSGEKSIQLKSDGVYVITGTVELKETTTIIGNGATILLKENVDGFLIPKNSIVENLKFRSGITGYNKIFCRLDDKSGYNVASLGYVKDLDFIGDLSCLGIGLGANDENTKGVVTYHKGDNLTFNNLSKGISFKNTFATSWYNGNNYTNITMYHCHNFITLEGTCDGNRFNGVQLQPSGIIETGIICNGNNNKFDVTSWDYNAYPDAVAYDFNGGFYNEINTNGIGVNHNNSKSHISNRLNGSLVEGFVLPKVNTDSTSIFTGSGTALSSLVNYNGNQDDILTMIDKTATITKNGEVVDFGVLFRANRLTATFDLEAGEEVEIKITPNSGFLNYIDIFGAMFTNAKPDFVNFSYETSNGFQNTINFDDLQNVYAYTNQINGSSIRWLAITFGVTTKRIVRLSRIFASSRYMPPTTFLKTDGGDVYGDIRLNEGRLVLNSPDGSKFRLNISNDGVLSTTKI